MEVLAGQNDEAFHADRFAALFNSEGEALPVQIVPNVGHIQLILDPATVLAAISAVDRLN